MKKLWLLEFLLIVFLAVGCGKASKATQKLFDAVVKGNIEQVKAALSEGADINYKDKREGNTPLIWAAHGGHIEIARLLIQKGADVNAVTSSGGTPLIYAAKFGNVEIVKLLLETGAKMDAREDGKSAVEWARTYGKDEIVKELEKRLTR